jgi:hypothetical protein
VANKGEQTPADIGRQIEARISSGDQREITLVTRRILDMTDVHAQAVREATRNQYAVPARQETLRHALTVGVVAAVAFWLLVLLGRAINDGKNVEPLIWGLIAAVAVLGGERIVTALLRRSPKIPSG